MTRGPDANPEADPDVPGGARAPVRVLFVCMGNICRSPTAHAVMKHLVETRGLAGQVEIDSAGTHDYHPGARSDPRTRAAGERRGYLFDHRARQVRPDDFDRFDHILVMDDTNLADIAAHHPPGGPRAGLVRPLLSHWPESPCPHVPDPYYGGPDGFERVLDLVESGCGALLEDLVKRHGLLAGR